MSVLKTEDFRQLPNSKWLQDVIECDIECDQAFYDDEEYFQEAHGSYSDELKNVRNSFKEGLEMMHSVLEKCVKTRLGEPIYFIENEWDWVSNLLLENIEPYTPWGVDEKPNMSDADDIIWLDWYDRYVSIVKREQKGFTPRCGCRAGYECKFAYVKIRDDDICKVYKRHTGNIHDDQECIDKFLEDDYPDIKSTYEWVYARCRQCLVPYGGIHHIDCEYERCPIPNCGSCIHSCCNEYSHQFINCIHNADVRYYKRPTDDDGLFEPGFWYHLNSHENHT
jgi:hypothetical protein